MAETKKVLNINNNNTKIKMVIYEFDSIISYWNLSLSIQNDIKELDNMRSDDFIGIFGGIDRIERLNNHFQHILCSNIHIVILSFTLSDIIIKALRRLKLLKYFYLIIGYDTSSYLEEKQCKKYDIKELKNISKLTFDQILYIDSNIKYINDVSNECQTYFIDNNKSYPFWGLTPCDFYNIECIIHNKYYDKYPIQQEYNTNQSLCYINNELYHNMFREIIQIWHNDDSIEVFLYK